ncbi:TRAP transporter small permease [Fusobacterium sp. PH5-44]|uniref:TRAP transporter small permease n=1 Tax=unclassified Fusobacterium TaxID=2648384 RepID=UPI003D25212A
MKTLNKILGSIIAILIGLMVIVCFWQVITRFVLQKPSKYTEEFLRYALIWLTMLGAPYAFGQNKHLALNFVTSNFQPNNIIKNKIVVEIIVLFLSVTVFFIGGILVTLNSSGQISPAMQLPMEIYYIGLPISGILTILYCIDHIVTHLKELKGGK